MLILVSVLLLCQIGFLSAQLGSENKMTLHYIRKYLELSDIDRYHCFIGLMDMWWSKISIRDYGFYQLSLKKLEG